MFIFHPAELIMQIKVSLLLKHLNVLSTVTHASTQHVHIAPGPSGQ